MFPQHCKSNQDSCLHMLDVLLMPLGGHVVPAGFGPGQLVQHGKHQPGYVRKVFSSAASHSYCMHSDLGSLDEFFPLPNLRQFLLYYQPVPRQMSPNWQLVILFLESSVPDPGSVIRCLFWTLDPGWLKNHISESLETILWVKILTFF